jgi:hypothetical protein
MYLCVCVCVYVCVCVCVQNNYVVSFRFLQLDTDGFEFPFT